MSSSLPDLQSEAAPNPILRRQNIGSLMLGCVLPCASADRLTSEPTAHESVAETLPHFSPFAPMLHTHRRPSLIPNAAMLLLNDLNILNTETCSGTSNGHSIPSCAYSTVQYCTDLSF